MPLSDPDQFQAWMESPLTKEFLSLLDKNHSHLTRAWGRGRVMTEWEQSRAQTLLQLAYLKHSRAQCDEGEASIEELMGAEWPEPEETKDG